MSDQYYIIGNPVAKSVSPAIHSEFARQMNQNMDYHARCVQSGGLQDIITACQLEKVKGVNVTSPCKVQVIDFVDQLHHSARDCGAVNTIKFDQDGQSIGYNTDGDGLVQDIVTHLGQVIRGKKVLVLGAGGAVRGIIKKLMAENPKKITLFNRSYQNAITLVNTLLIAPEIEVLQTHTQLENYDIIINATSASLHGMLPEGIEPALFQHASFVYDLSYNLCQPTAFCHFAKEAGAKQVVDGWGMVLFQAAKAFYYWRGVFPKIDETYYNALKQACQTRLNLKRMHHDETTT